jgi:hypothetical protein
MTTRLVPAMIGAALVAATAGNAATQPTATKPPQPAESCLEKQDPAHPILRRPSFRRVLEGFTGGGLVAFGLAIVTGES